MSMEQDVVRTITQEVVTSQYDVTKWYTYPFDTDVDFTEEDIEKGVLSRRKLDVIKYDFVAEILRPVMDNVCNKLGTGTTVLANPDMELVYDTVRDTILELIS